MRTHRLPFLAVFLPAALAAPPAIATDGVIEINQAKVVASGGFPFVINEAGSYRLTSNLDVTVAANPLNTHAINVIAHRVTIDLNGFSIVGPSTCTESPTNCPSVGDGDGIHALVGGDSTSSITVKNGSIRGMGNYGIYVEGFGIFQNLSITHCAGGGLVVSGAVDQVQANVNGNSGIGVSSGSVSRSIAYRNKGTGITVANSVVTGNWSHENSVIGIYAASSVVRDNVSSSNTGVELNLVGSAWSGNLLHSCAPSACVAGAGLQVGINDCDGVACPP